MLLLLSPGHKTVLAIMFGVMGFFMLPVLPVAFELGVECTYPVREEIPTGLLMATGQIFTTGLVFL